MTQYRYGALTQDDAPALAALRQEGVAAFPLGFLITSEEAAETTPDLSTTRGVFAEGQLIGFCGYRPQSLARTRHRAELGPFYVTAQHQGKGAAGTLMQGVIDEAKASGLQRLELFVDEENLRAIAFYKRYGFTHEFSQRDAVRIDGAPRIDQFYWLDLT